MNISIQKLGGTATQTRCHQEGGLRRAPGHSYSHPTLAAFAGQTCLVAFPARRLQGVFSRSPACRIWAAKRYIYIYIKLYMLRKNDKHILYRSIYIYINIFKHVHLRIRLGRL